MADTARPLRLYLVAGEHSGDALGARLIAALREEAGVPLELAGVGGELMQAEGCPSLFPLSDIAVMGPIAILRQLPFLLRRINETARDALSFDPDILIILDSPEFTHQVAKRVRKKAPQIPIIDYVSPSVWAWRPGRAKKMRRYVDHILAILPFEPEAHRRLGGPACTYVGHPLAERIEWLKQLDGAPLREQLGIPEGVKVLTVLPGSRGSEVERLMQPFGEALALIKEKIPDLAVVLPTMQSVKERVLAATKDWPIAPHIVEGSDAKFQSFKLGDAALAASGTVTLELALARIPMVVAYKVDPLAAYIRYFMTVDMVALPNLILGRKAFPELLQMYCTPEALAEALLPLLQGGPERDAQLKSLDEVIAKVAKEHRAPALEATKVVLDYRDTRAAAEAAAKAAG
ncbi:lipid-A-disaccharide synthase [Methyloligella sp. 2.7D]|uniref:lipid-A-disaccharide synthase n=1 Tax=unclassified Methyloligella TaxID=2625955 RepID=UPI00157CA69F|nr:lipid-A-disaccharide synthase [Methyloligella sp. GL2]QKP77516.1 lipid-A-disaccharide synthase [Methyloligella sp. GL2]